MKNNHIIQKQNNQTHKSRTQADPFRKSQLKQSEIVIGGICCSRHLQCIHNQGIKSTDPECDSISVSSELLRQVSPQEISTQPWLQYQKKPEVDMIVQVNIKKKRYEKLIEQYQKEQKQQQKKKMIEKVREDAKKALSKSKKIQKPHSKDWGHSVFTYNMENQVAIEKKEKGQLKETGQKKIELKPINQRIAEYKHQQLKRIKSTENIQRKLRQDLKVEESKQKIQQNAEKILEEMRKEKEKRDEQRCIVEAKIRAIQIKSLKNIQHCKKKPLENDIQFKLGDSQYSTFQARAENRKIVKKEKKKKIQETADPNLLVAAESKNSKYSSKASKGKKQTAKNKKQEKKIQENRLNNVMNSQKQNDNNKVEEIKGPFFIWNIPITVQDQEKLQRKSKDVFMNVNRFNYKQGKTFREEANEFLAKKMQKKMQESVERRKYENFLDKVAQKKQLLVQDYKKQQNNFMNQVFWNEDQVFKASILENFHFYAKENQK